jgi:cysteine desulfurase
MLSKQMYPRIYLDNNATTKPDVEVLARYSGALQSYFGNPSSVHFEGQTAKAALVEARVAIGQKLKVDSHEILFTSSATEALNLILRGIVGFRPHGHIITSNLEHAAVFRTLQSLSKQGQEITFLSGNSFGAVTAEQVLEAIRPTTKLISLMAVNNETGVCTDIEAIAAIAQKLNIAFVVDGVALLGKDPCVIHEGISAMTFSGHKFHAPKGTGVAFIRKGVKLQPYLTGGEQEFGRRGGTENVAAAIAVSLALDMAIQRQAEVSKQMARQRMRFESKILSLYPEAKINGAGPRICNTSNICFSGIDGEALLLFLDLHGLSASMGSACASGTLEPSRVLLNMGLSQDDALSSLRFSLSRDTTDDEIDQAVEIIEKGIRAQSLKR